MNLRRLKNAGIERMHIYLDSLDTETPSSYPAAILQDPATSDSVGADVAIEARPFSSKLEFASYLDGVFEAAGLADVGKDRGLWSWLALFFLPSVCPKKRDVYVPGARARWIPEVDDFRRYYRHLLAGPYAIYRANRDNPRRAMSLLFGPLSRQGDLVEQLASRQELISNKALVETATVLYYDGNSSQMRRGSGGKGPGSPRRLAEVLDQFDLTWDFYSMTAGELVALLPSEFDRFRN